MTDAATEMADLMAYDDLCARVYHDRRLPPGTREVALALAWAGLRDPDRAAGTSTSFARAGRLLGRDAGGRGRHKLLIAKDAPRYDELVGRWADGPGNCEGTRLRPYRPRIPKPDPSVTQLHPPMFYDGHGGAVPLSQASHRANPGNVCGARGSTSVREYDLTTGQLRTEHWFCRRHRDQADRVRAQIEAAGERPEPIPNTGGLLPCYFGGDWERIYQWASPGWRRPFHGLCADDWPTLTQQVLPRKPRLSVVL